MPVQIRWPRHRRGLPAVALIPACWLLLPAVSFSAVEVTETPVTVQVSESAAPATLIAALGDGTADWRWEFTGPTAPTALVIDAESGRVTLAPEVALDHESQPTLECRIVARLQTPVDPAEQLFSNDLRDSGVPAATVDERLGRSRVIALVVQVLDAPEAPVWPAAAVPELHFNLTQPLREHRLPATDPDASDALRYEIVAGNNDGWLHCDPASGRLSLSKGDLRSLLHGSAEQRFQLSVRVTDSHGLSTERTVPVAVTDPAAWFVSDIAASNREPPTQPAPLPVVVTAIPVVVVSTSNVRATTPAVVTPAAGRGPGSRTPARADDALTANRRMMHRVLAWGLVAVCLLGLAAVTAALLRRRRPTAANAPADAAELHAGPAILPEAVARSLALSAAPARSLRAEMSELLAVSQHFSMTQRAHVERRFHGRQFRLAAVGTVAAATIVAIQSLFGLEHAFDQENLLVFACLCVATAAALRALFAVRVANDRIQQGGPLSGQFQLDKPSAA